MRVQKVYEIVYGRMPRPEEIQLAVRFIAGEKAKQKDVSAGMKTLTETAEMGASKKALERATRSDALKAIQNKGDVVERKTLSPWETYAQALLFSNEASYIN